MMEIINRRVFFDIQQTMTTIPHTQHKGWLEYVETKRQKGILYFVDDAQHPTICCWGEIYTQPFVGRVLRIEGETIREEKSVKAIKEFYDGIVQYVKEHKFAFVRVSSNLFYDTNYEIGIRQAGFIRPMSLTLCPLTVVLKPDRNRKPKKSWHYQYAQAKRSNLRFESVEHPSEENIRLFVKMYAEMATTKGLSHVPNERSLSKLLQYDEYRLFFVYSPENVPLAVHLDYMCHHQGFHIMAANTNEARNHKGATHYLIESVFEWMKERGIDCYDLGRIGPGIRSSNSVCEFKRYSGGEERVYNGEWIYTNKKWTEYLYAFYLSKKGIDRF